MVVNITLENTDMGKIYRSGQCFGISRNPYNFDEYWCVSGRRFCRVVKSEGGNSVLTCFDEDRNYWWNYFDMDTDYVSIGEIYVNTDKSELSEVIVDMCRGLRVLNQEFPDCLISFITSQRKSVPAIRTAMDSLCRAYGECYELEKYFGEEYEGFEIYTFPSEDVYRHITQETLNELGYGYRSPYVVSAFNELSKGSISEKELREVGYFDAKASLMKLHGVGEKVANCVLLYSLGYKEAYPRDVWIFRFEEEYYNGRFPDEKYLGYAGIVQLWQYYFMLNR